MLESITSIPGYHLYMLIPIIFISAGIHISRSRGLSNKQKAEILLMFIIVFCVIIGIPVLANVWLASRVETQPFWIYFSVSYGVFFFANLWDLIVFDYVLVVRFRSSFLTLPDTPYYPTMQPHIKGWFRGLVIGLVTSLVVALISMWLI